jgi:hypothetical protein
MKEVIDVQRIVNNCTCQGACYRCKISIPSRWGRVIQIEEEGCRTRRRNTSPADIPVHAVRGASSRADALAEASSTWQFTLQTARWQLASPVF